MTCVIGYKTEEGIWMGADSAGTDGFGSQMPRADTKVFHNGPMTFGFCGSFRMGQLLRFNLKVPAQAEGLSDFEFMVTNFVDAVRKTLKRGGFTHKKNNVESGGEFLVAYKDSLYHIEEDFQVGLDTRDFVAIGSGTWTAGGAMAVLSELGMAPRQAILKALKIVADQDAYVAAPFVVIKHKG